MQCRLFLRRGMMWIDKCLFSRYTVTIVRKGMLRMKKMMKLLCLVMAVLMALSLCACGGQDGSNKEDNSQEKEKYIGTWKGSDHDGENIVHYLIFDGDGYWKVYMNYTTLVRAIKQLPDQLVSFKIFCQLQNSGQTGCYYEYAPNGEDVDFTDMYTVNEDGLMTEVGIEGVTYTKMSTYSGEPDETIVAESADLFDRAREEALF